MVTLTDYTPRQLWELLADDEQTRRYLFGVLMSSRPAADAAVERAFGKVTT